MTKPLIRAFFNEPTNTITYLIADPRTGEAAVIDPVLDFDVASATVDTESAVEVLMAAAAEDWRIVAVLETHVHADHLSAAPLFKARTGAWIGIGSRIRDVQKIFRPMFAADDVEADGGDFDRLFDDGEQFALGDLTVEVLATPGHTPADVSYKIGDALFVGDTLFMPDYGTARTDFPGGDARQLYRSIQRILAAERAANVHIGGGKSEDEFVAMRKARDATLAAPKLLLPSIQVNIRAGRFPPAEANGVSYLRIPVKTKSAGAAT